MRDRREPATVLDGLNLRRRGRDVGVDQRRGLRHVLLHLVLLVLDNLLLHDAAAAPAATAALWLRLRSRLVHRNLLHLAVRAVVTAIQLAAFLLALELDDRRFDPLVLRDLLHAFAN